jgi:dihydroorotase
VTTLASTLVQQVRVLNPLSASDYIADVWLEDGKIKAIAPRIASYPEEINIINGEGCILAPGLNDLYSRSGEPGNEERDTLVSLIKAATAGGFTSVSILPNTDPPVDRTNIVHSLLQKSQRHTSNRTARLQFWGSLTMARSGQQLTELADLAPGVIGFTDNRPIENLGLLRRLLEYIKPLGKPIALVGLNPQLQGNGVMREGIMSTRLGLPGNPEMAETSALAAILEVVAAVNTPVHLMRISTAGGVRLVARAKDMGLPITASVSWMHLLLNTEAVASYDTSLRLEPPLGNEIDRLALLDGIKCGTIDAIAVDHSSYTYEEKTVTFAEAPPGAIGLELALPLLWDNLVTKGELSALQLWSALSINPAGCSGRTPVNFISDNMACGILFDPRKVWRVQRDNLQTLGNNTPWWGQCLRGRVLEMWN